MIVYYYCEYVWNIKRVEEVPSKYNQLQAIGDQCQYPIWLPLSGVSDLENTFNYLPIIHEKKEGILQIYNKQMEGWTWTFSVVVVQVLGKYLLSKKSNNNNTSSS